MIAAEDTMSVVVVALGRERYGIPIGHVREIRPLGGVARVPGAGERWLGLSKARGELVAVLDLAGHLGIGDPPGGDPQLMLVEADGLVVGLSVRVVVGVRSVALAEIGPPLDPGEGAPVLGLTPDIVAILDVPALLADPALVVRDAAE